MITKAGQNTWQNGERWVYKTWTDFHQLQESFSPCLPRIYQQIDARADLTRCVSVCEWVTCVDYKSVDYHRSSRRGRVNMTGRGLAGREAARCSRQHQQHVKSGSGQRRRRSTTTIIIDGGWLSTCTAGSPRSDTSSWQRRLCMMTSERCRRRWHDVMQLCDVWTCHVGPRLDTRCLIHLRYHYCVGGWGVWQLQCSVVSSGKNFGLKFSSGFLYTAKLMCMA